MHLLQILEETHNVSLFAVRVEELIDLFLTRCFLFPILSITLHRHPCHTWKSELFGRQIVLRHTESLTPSSHSSGEERKDIKGKDTFDLSDWWKSNCATLPTFGYVLREVLTNSCPSERLFSVFNSTYGLQ
jgi:hypothetical protein